MMCLYTAHIQRDLVERYMCYLSQYYYLSIVVAVKLSWPTKNRLSFINSLQLYGVNKLRVSVSFSLCWSLAICVQYVWVVTQNGYCSYIKRKKA